MNKPLIGINALTKTNPEHFEDSVRAVVDSGYDAMELCLSALPLLAGGEIVEPYADYTADILARYPLRYTAHIGVGLDLRNREDFTLHNTVLRSSIDLCERLGMDRLTLHFESESPDPERETMFFDAHAQAAEYAAHKGVLLLMENIEVEDYRKVIHMVDALDRDNFKMTLDTGHLYLSTRYFGGDYETAVRECAPYVGHVHLNDNTGRFEPMRLENFALYKTLPMGMRTALGSGDVHMPPLWGNIPMKRTLELLCQAGFDGVLICEYENDLYRPFLGQIQTAVRELADTVFVF